MRPPANPWLRTALFALALGVLLPALAADPPSDKALFTVRLPAGAVLTVDEAATKSTGPERSFITPVLDAGKVYAYTLVATWEENGAKKSRTEKVWVRPGKHMIVDLTAEAVAEKKEPEPEGKKEPEAKKEEVAVKSRTFQFTYAATISGLKPGQKARVWLPVPPSNEHQDVKLVDDKGLPEGFQTNKEPEYGNEIIYADATADKDGKIPLAAIYLVTRREAKGAAKADPEMAEQIARFLQPDKRVPIDGKPLELLKDKELPADQTESARVMYETVNGHMKYGKPEGKGWGNGDSEYACQEGVGNCTDFHSLFISLARSRKIPAKFEIGFSVPENRGAGDVQGYHCWAFFKPEGKGWVPVDISEANKHPDMKDYYFGNLTEDRVTFSTGRDIKLVPEQGGAPVNFLVFPYVEVGGKPLPDPRKQVQMKSTYKDVTADEEK